MTRMQFVALWLPIFIFGFIHDWVAWLLDVTLYSRYRRDSRPPSRGAMGGCARERGTGRCRVR